MSFSERAKAVALAIVKIFETSKPFGNYSAVAVLADGAGISYGTSQFTHKSGSLAAVLKRYQRLGGILPSVVADALSDFAFGRNISGRSADSSLKVALKELGKTSIMQQAQREIAFENYLRPALNAAEGSDFVYPLSLAVIYDSINQGGYDTVRDRTKFDVPGNGSIKPEEFEQEWIAEYCRQRKAWLGSPSRKPIVRKTTYRPEFFLGEIKRGNWNLNLPMTVHGHKLTEAILFPKTLAVAPADNPPTSAALNPDGTETSKTELSASEPSPFTHAVEPPPVIHPQDEITKTEVIQTAEGAKETVTVVTKNEQDVNETVTQAGPKPYNEIGLKDTLISDAKAAIPASVGFQTFQEVASQATGWPEWVVGLIGKLALILLVITACWLLYRLFSWLLHNWRENERVKLMATINTDITRKNIQFCEVVMKDRK